MKDKVSTGARRGRRRRLFLFGLLGGVLGLLVVGFFARVYNPFGAHLEDPLMLMPNDVDLVLHVPDAPGFAGEIRERRFVATLRRHRGFQRFLDSPSIVETGVADKVDQAFRALDQVREKLPFGLDLADLVGDKIVVGAYVPAVPTEAWPFFCIFRPKSWLAQAGVNVLLDTKLAGWFVDDELRRQGVEVEHTRDSVKLTPKGSPPLFLTRIADAVVLSTEGRQLDRIRNSVTRDGLPTRVDRRFASLDATDLSTGRAPSDLDILGRHEVIDRTLGVSERLRREWGLDTYELARSLVPPLGGQDLTARLSVAQGLTLEIVATRGSVSETSLYAALAGFSDRDLKRRLAEFGPLLPEGGFGTVVLDTHLAGFLRRGIAGGTLLSPAERRIYDDALALVSSVKNLEGALAILDATLDNGVAAAFFKQPRERLDDEAEAGYALLCPLRDEERLRAQLAEIADEVVRSGGSAVRDLQHRRIGATDLYEILLNDARDPRVTRPAVALHRGFLIISNFAPYLEAMAGNFERQRSLAGQSGIQRAVSYAPDRLRGGCLVDVEALYPYMDQSVTGWAFAKTVRLDGRAQAELSQRLEQDARLRGLQPGSLPFDEFVSERWKRETTGRMVDVERTIRFHIDCFRGLFSSMGIFVEDAGTEARYRIRLDVNEDAP